MSISSAAIRRLMKEIKQLKTEPQDSIRIVTDEDDMLKVTGIVQGPDGTPYAGGYFRIKFTFTEEFPAAPPKCTMLTRIFHPNVSKTGEICVNTLKKDWKKEYGIAHILVTVKCLLIYPNPESALDEAAGKLLLEDYAEYCKHAKLMTQVHATPKTRPAEFDVPSVIPATKAGTKETIAKAPVASTSGTANPTPTSNAPFRHTTPTPNVPATRLQPPMGRQNSPAPSPLTPSTAQLTTTGTTTTKPISKSSPAAVVEPLQFVSNGKNDQNVDPSETVPRATSEVVADTATKPVVKPAPTAPSVKPVVSASAPLKRSAGTATGGVEKRKKGLKRL